VYVSQDGAHAGVTGVIEDFARRFAQAAPDVPFTHWRHPDADVRVPPDQAQYAGYYKLGAALRLGAGPPLRPRRRTPL